MAASAWTFYDSFRRYMADGQIDLDADEFLMGLFQSTSNADTITLSVIGSLTNEVANGSGYLTGGKTLTGITWSAGAAESVLRFDVTNPIWTATGGNIANIRYAVIYRNGASAGIDKMVCKAALTTAQFTLNSGNTLTVTINSSGVFELS